MAKIATDSRGKPLISGTKPFDTVRRDAERESFAFANTKTSVELQYFDSYQRKKTTDEVKKQISVRKHGLLIGKELAGFEPGANYEILLNKKATIIALRPCRNGYRMTNRREIYCRRLIDALIEQGVELPLRFDADWDEELGAWVGRR